MPLDYISQLPKEFREAHAEDLKPLEGKPLEEVLDSSFKLQKTVKERGIIVPTKDSPPEEIEEFHRRMDLPKAADGYKIVLPADAVLPKESVAELQKYAFDNSLSQKQAQAYANQMEAVARAARAAGANRTEGLKKGYEDALLKEFGGDKAVAEAAHNLAAKHLSTFYSPETRQVLIDNGVVFNPKFIRDAANAQGKIEPKGMVQGDPGQGAGPKKEERGRMGDYSDSWKQVHGGVPASPGANR